MYSKELDLNQNSMEPASKKFIAPQYLKLISVLYLDHSTVRYLITTWICRKLLQEE